MNSFLNYFAACVLSTMLIVLPPLAQDVDAPAPPPAEKASETTVEKEAPAKKSVKRSRTSRTTYEDITVIGGAPVWIKKGETARTVVAIGSDVQVDGSILDDLVVVLGNVRLGPESQVARGPVIVGGNLDSEPGSKLGLNPVVLSLSTLGGVTNIVSPVMIQAGKRWFAEGILRARPLPHQLPLAWMVSGLLLLFFVLIGLLFQRPVTAAVAMLDQKPGSALMLGILISVLALPFLLLLIVSVVGVILLPLVVCALGMLFIVGKVAVYRYSGQTLGNQLGLSVFENPLVALLSGALLFYAAYTVPVIGAVVWLLIAPLGIGAVALASLNRGKPGEALAAASPGVPLSDASLAETGAPPVLLPRVGFWLRFLATLLDLLLVGLVMALVFRGPKWFLLAWTVYHIALWSWKGTTVGGIIFGLRIVRADGSAMSVPVAVIRYLGGFFSAVVAGLGFFWAGWTRDRQSWHDKIAGTVVARYPRSSPLF